jgi:hypothetical protein
VSGNFDPKESGYIEVKDRIEKFYEKFPDGSLQSEIVQIDEEVVVVKGLAYRTADDERPGIGHSMMRFGGNNPYTKDSEIENAETSAWGRALAALGFEVKKAIASAEEVQNKQGESPKSSTSSRVKTPPAPEESAPAGDPTAPSTQAQITKLKAWGKKVLGDDNAVREFVLSETGVRNSKQLTQSQMQQLYDKLAVIEATGGTLVAQGASA